MFDLLNGNIPKGVKYTFETDGVCAKSIDVWVDADSLKIEHVVFNGGCPGNGIAVGLLCKGKQMDEVISILSGVKCGGRPTSCSDQLTRALREIQTKL